jgi:hypothetical protein
MGSGEGSDCRKGQINEGQFQRRIDNHGLIVWGRVPSAGSGLPHGAAVRCDNPYKLSGY